MRVLPHICTVHAPNKCNTDVRMSIIMVSKLKQVIKMAEAVQQVLVESTSKEQERAIAGRIVYSSYGNLSNLGTSNSGISHAVDGPAFNA